MHRHLVILNESLLDHNCYRSMKNVQYLIYVLWSNKFNSLYHFIVRPTPTPFSDKCQTKNCYAGCGESPYGNEDDKGSDVTIRRMNVELSEVLKSDKLPAGVKKVTVYAQTAKLSKTIDLSFDIVVVARQVGSEAKHRHYR